MELKMGIENVGFELQADHYIRQNCNCTQKNAGREDTPKTGKTCEAGSEGEKVSIFEVAPDTY